MILSFCSKNMRNANGLYSSIKIIINLWLKTQYLKETEEIQSFDASKIKENI